VTTHRALRPCGTGSCVSTQAPRTEPLRRIEPMRFAGPAALAMEAVRRVLGRTPRVHVLERDDLALHAVARTSVLRIPRDIEVVVDEAAALLHLRVATAISLRERSGSRPYAIGLLQQVERELRSMR
jgi:uncharacterized protein (DUF1499 family)